MTSLCLLLCHINEGNGTLHCSVMITTIITYSSLPSPTIFFPSESSDSTQPEAPESYRSYYWANQALERTGAKPSPPPSGRTVRLLLYIILSHPSSSAPYRALFSQLHKLPGSKTMRRTRRVQTMSVPQGDKSKDRSKIFSPLTFHSRSTQALSFSLSFRRPKRNTD